MGGAFASGGQIAALMGQAVNCLNRGDNQGAESVLTRLLAMRPAEPDGLQLLGLVRYGQGRFADADELYRRSLALRPAQPHVRMNLGNALLAQGLRDEAIAAYRASIKDKPDYADAHMNLGRALHDAGDLGAAEKSFRNALRHQPSNLLAKHGLGAVMNDAERPEEAEVVLSRAIPEARDPALLASLEHNLGIAMRRQKRYAQALEHYDRALKHVPNLPSADYNRASALQHLGRLDEAVAAYRRALSAEPLHLKAHQELNGLLYRMTRDGDFLRSYDEAMVRVPQSHPAAATLAVAKAGFLVKLSRFGEAAEILSRAQSQSPDNPLLCDRLALAYQGLGDWSKAIAAHEAAVRLVPDDPIARTNFAVTLLQAREAKRAEAIATEAMARAPLDQYAIAVWGLALRATADARADTLHGFDDFVQIYDLEPPDGYADMESFNRDLNARLDALHTDNREHIDQSLRGGTQTFEQLFGAGDPLVEALRGRIEGALGRYVARMDEAKDHPLLGRRAGAFKFAGSWSSRLRDCGFHANHVHTMGWISSCYYVGVPDAVADAQAQQGWIKFGEPPFELGLERPIQRSVQPKAGRLVLFPSYMWHGTVPFRSSTARTTIAFDAVPD